MSPVDGPGATQADPQRLWSGARLTHRGACARPTCPPTARWIGRRRRRCPASGPPPAAVPACERVQGEGPVRGTGLSQVGQLLPHRRAAACVQARPCRCALCKLACMHHDVNQARASPLRDPPCPAPSAGEQGCPAAWPRGRWCWSGVLSSCCARSVQAGAARAPHIPPSEHTHHPPCPPAGRCRCCA